MRLLLYTRKSAKEISSILGLKTCPRSAVFQENDRRECLGLPEKSETGRIANCCGIIAISYVVENKELCKNKNQVILLKPFKK